VSILTETGFAYKFTFFLIFLYTFENYWAFVIFDHFPPGSPLKAPNENVKTDTELETQSIFTSLKYGDGKEKKTLLKRKTVK